MGRLFAIAIAILAVSAAACGGAAVPGASSTDTTQPPGTAVPPGVGAAATTTTVDEWWPWVEVSGDGAEPDARFLDVEPPHMAVLAAVIGYDLTARPEGDDWERGALAGLWTNPFGEYFIGVAGPDAPEIAARAAATAAVVGGGVTVYIGNHTEDELRVAAVEIWDSGVPVVDVFTDITTNRVVVSVLEGDRPALEAAIAGMPSTMVHIETMAPPEPIDPLNADIEYRCGAVGATADGTLILQPLDADAESALLDLFDLPEGDWLPGLDAWGIASKTSDEMVLGAQTADGSYDAVFELDREGRWVPRGWGGCTVIASLPGYGVATWEADGPPDPTSTTISLLATERACANGRAPDGREVVPVVVETEDTVTITVFVEPVVGGASCPGNPPFAVEVELGAPLGDRAMVDGSGVTAP